jgi:hypothetical protein
MGRFFYESCILKKLILFLLLLSFSYGFIYEFKAKNGYGKEVKFLDFEDKILIIFVSSQETKINTQLETLNKLYNKYKMKNISFVGFAIKKTPLNETNFCVLNYGVDFEMIGVINNKLSKLKKYISHIYNDENPNLYAPILIHNREIVKLESIYGLKNKLIEIF